LFGIVLDEAATFLRRATGSLANRLASLGH
jgi:hypothetical protein